MIRTASKWLRRGVLLSVLVLMGLGALLAARLASGPVSLSPLTTYVEQTLDDALEGLDVSVGDLVLRWSGEDSELQLRLLDVLLKGQRGGAVANVPEMDVALSLSALGNGVVAPTRISLIGPSANIIRKKDGSFNVAVGGDEVALVNADDEKPILEEVIDLFLLDRSQDSGSAYLREVEITNAKLVFFDQESGTYWLAPDSVLGLAKQDGGIAGYLTAAPEFGTSKWHISVSGFLDPDSKFLDIEGQFEDVVLSKLQNAGKGFDAFKGLNFPVTGSYSATMSTDGELVSAKADLIAREGTIAPRFFNGDAINIIEVDAEVEYDASTGRVLLDKFDLKAAEGEFEATGTVDVVLNRRGDLTASYFDLDVDAVRINLPNVFTEPGGIDHLALRGRWSAKRGLVEVESASLRAGDSNFQVSGTVGEFSDVSPPIQMEGEFSKFDVDLLPSLWPIRVANGAHDWIVANLSNGQLYDGKLKVDFAPGDLDNPKLPDESLRLDFSYSGISARYINGLPPITGGRGKAKLFGDRFELSMSGGKTGELAVSNGKVVITELHRKPSHGDISVVLTGTSSELLRILDLDPLGYPSEFGVDPKTVGGDTSLKLDVSLPMVRDLAFKDVGFDGLAKLSKLQIPNVINEVGIDDGKAEIVVTNTYLDAKGVLTFGELDANVTWREEFDAERLPTTIKVTADLDGKDASVFGADLSSYLMSDAKIELILRGQGQDVQSAKVEADFQDALLMVEEMGWVKPIGQSARGEISVSSRASGGWDFKDIRFLADEADLNGEIRIADDGRIERARFPQFKLGPETDAKIDFENTRKLTKLSVTGKALNISGLIDRILNNATSGAEEEPTVKPLNVDLSLNQLTLANGVALQDVKGQLKDTGGRIASADFEGTFVDGGVVFAAIDPVSDVERSLRLTASDAGKLLSGVDFTDQLEGGQLDVAAKLTELADPEGDQDFDLVTNGEMSLNRFRVVNAPILAQLLMAGSPQGAQDLLNQNGIGFDRFYVPFQISRGRISFDRSQALGPAIGITVGGVIDQSDDELDLTGTIVPSYSINSAIGYVPVFGPLLVSREGEGLFAFTYNIQGALEDPKIAVNPLSGLAPGFLRRIFQIGENKTVVPKLKPLEQ